MKFLTESLSCCEEGALLTKLYFRICLFPEHSISHCLMAREILLGSFMVCLIHFVWFHWVFLQCVCFSLSHCDEHLTGSTLKEKGYILAHVWEHTVHMTGNTWLQKQEAAGSNTSTVRNPRMNEQKVVMNYRTSGPTSSEPLPPLRLYLLRVLEPSKKNAVSKSFRHIGLCIQYWAL